MEAPLVGLLTPPGHASAAVSEVSTTETVVSQHETYISSVMQSGSGMPSQHPLRQQQGIPSGIPNKDIG